MGDDWEEEMKERLAETEYDADLGMDMAEDAMRLVQGEITEAEFQSKYHDAVVEEFDVEEAQLPDALSESEGCEDGSCGCGDDGGQESVIERFDGLADASEGTRRDMMKKMGIGAAAASVGGSALTSGNSNPYAAAEEEENTDGKRYGMVIDLERCDGCLQCVTGCMEENNTSTGANWMYVLTYEDESTEEDNFMVRPCQHCSNAPCEKVCPVEARHTRESSDNEEYGGLVLTDYETCIGCRYCQVACPYGVNYFQWGDPDIGYDDDPFEDRTYKGATEDAQQELLGMSRDERQQELKDAHDHVFDQRGLRTDSRPVRGTMGKCTMCPSRQDGHERHEDEQGNVTKEPGSTACQDACENAGMNAIHFGDMNDPESRPRRYLDAREKKHSEEGTIELTDSEEIGDEPWAATNTNDGEGGWSGKLSTFKLLEQYGTEPNITYIGNPPGDHAEQKEGPVAYEQQTVSPTHPVDVVDNRKDHLDKFDILAGKVPEDE
jgi:molybdopterin-containing oxidoreductase family iron-sulfur binding subunit